MPAHHAAVFHTHGEGLAPRRCQAHPDQGVLGRLNGGTRFSSYTFSSGKPGRNVCHGQLRQEDHLMTRVTAPSISVRHATTHTSWLAGSGELGPRKRYGHHHSLCRAYVPLPVRYSCHLTLSIVRRRQDWRAHACCDRAHLFSLYATGSYDQEASPFFRCRLKGNICPRSAPGTMPYGSEESRRFFSVVPFLGSQQRGTEKAFPGHRLRKPQDLIRRAMSTNGRILLVNPQVPKLVCPTYLL